MRISTGHNLSVANPDVGCSYYDQRCQATNLLCLKAYYCGLGRYVCNVTHSSEWEKCVRRKLQEYDSARTAEVCSRIRQIYSDHRAAAKACKEHEGLLSKIIKRLPPFMALAISILGLAGLSVLSGATEIFLLLLLGFSLAFSILLVVSPLLPATRRGQAAQVLYLFTAIYLVLLPIGLLLAIVFGLSMLAFPGALIEADAADTLGLAVLLLIMPVILSLGLSGRFRS